MTAWFIISTFLEAEKTVPFFSDTHREVKVNLRTLTHVTKTLF